MDVYVPDAYEEEHIEFCILEGLKMQMNIMIKNKQKEKINIIDIIVKSEVYDYA